MKKILPFVIIALISITPLFGQSGYFVELSDGTIYEGKIEVSRPFLKKSRFIINDSTIVLMERVERYNISEGYFVRMHKGVGETFARRIEKGNIDLFTRSVQSGVGGWTPTGPNGSMAYIGGGGSHSVEYFSKNNGPLLEANARNLKRELVDNPISMRYLKKRDTQTAIMIIGILGGLTLSGVSLAYQADKEAVDPTAPVAGLVMVSLSSLIPRFIKKDLTKKAIKAYNHPERYN